MFCYCCLGDKLVIVFDQIHFCYRCFDDKLAIVADHTHFCYWLKNADNPSACYRHRADGYRAVFAEYFVVVADLHQEAFVKVAFADCFAVGVDLHSVVAMDYWAECFAEAAGDHLFVDYHFFLFLIFVPSPMYYLIRSAKPVWLYMFYVNE